MRGFQCPQFICRSSSRIRASRDVRRKLTKKEKKSPQSRKVAILQQLETDRSRPGPEISISIRPSASIFPSHPHSMRLARHTQPRNQRQRKLALGFATHSTMYYTTTPTTKTKRKHTAYHLYPWRLLHDISNQHTNNRQSGTRPTMNMPCHPCAGWMDGWMPRFAIACLPCLASLFFFFSNVPVN